MKTIAEVASEVNLAEALDYLDLFPYPTVLTAIPPSRDAVVSKWVKDRAASEAFLKEKVLTHNLYHAPNKIKETYTKDKKAEKADYQWAHVVQVDIDPSPLDGWRDCPEAGPERAAWLAEHWQRNATHMMTEKLRIQLRLSQTAFLKLDIPHPTLIVDTGGGYQCVWILDTDSRFVFTDEEKIARIENRNKWLREKLDGDRAAVDVSRILRLPGTLNIPDARKVAKGREPTATKLIKHLDNHHSHLCFQEVAPVAAKVDRKPVTITSLDDLAQYGVDTALKHIIAQGHDPDNPKPDDNSRSVWFWQVIMALVRGGAPDNVLHHVLRIETDWHIGDSIRDRGRGAAKYLDDQIEKARTKAMEWQKNAKGDKLANVRHNWMVALRELGVEVRRNTFEDVVEVSGLRGFDGRLSDDAEIEMRVVIDTKWPALKPGKDEFHDMLVYLSNRNRYHPVCDYLDGLKWDGVERIDTWLTKYAGAEDTPLTRAIGAIWLTAAVKRVRSPGCKFDEMLILEQSEGTLKSTAMETLAGGWFSDSLQLGTDSKETIELTNGKWIIEIAELRGLKRDVLSIKAFLSRRKETARMAYARNTVTVPRQFVCVGTTNHSEYLADTTGNRRFWPVKVVKFDIEALKVDRDQIWAEAAEREASGASIRLDESLWPAATEEQKKRRVDDPWVEALQAALPKGDIRVFNEDVWKLLNIPIERRTQTENVRLAEVMKQMGFEKGKDARRDGKNPRPNYVRGPGPSWTKVQFENRTDGRNWSHTPVDPGANDYSDADQEVS